jgi:hypothetical protein
MGRLWKMIATSLQTPVSYRRNGGGYAKTLARYRLSARSLAAGSFIVDRLAGFVLKLR